MTFIFPSDTDRPPDGTYYAPLNKPCALGSLAAWWMSHANLDPDVAFVLVDPDMIWHAPLAPADIPARGTINCHLLTEDGDDAPAFAESPFRNPCTQTTPHIFRVIGGNWENAGLYRQVGERITAAGA